MQTHDFSRGVPAKFSSVKRFIRIHQVNQPMRNPLSFRFRWRIRSNVHSSINLSGIRGQELGVEELGHGHGHATLPDCRWSHENEKGLQRGIYLAQGLTDRAVVTGPGLIV